MLLVDCVTSLGGIPVEVYKGEIDIAYNGTQKCLGAPPGLSPFTAGKRAIERMLDRPSSWYLDLNLIAAYVADQFWVGRITTPLRSTRYAPCMPHSERFSTGARRGPRTSSRVWCVSRTRDACCWLQPFFRRRQPSSHLVPAYLPDCLDEAPTRRLLLDDDGIDVGGGLGDVAGMIWGVSAMGHSARVENVNRFLASKRRLLSRASV